MTIPNDMMDASPDDCPPKAPRSGAPSIPRVHKFRHAQKPAFKASFRPSSRPAKPSVSNGLNLPQVTRLPPSPKRKRPRTNQSPKKRKKEVQSVGLQLRLDASKLTSSPRKPRDPNVSTPLRNDSQLFDWALEDDEPASPGLPRDNGEHEIASAVSQVELQLALQLPQYRDAVKWSPESCSQLTKHCFILQDWDIRKKALQVCNHCGVN